MADNNNLPDGFELATDIDPQSAIAAKGLDPLIAQADKNLQNQYNTALSASQVQPNGQVGTPEANQALADQSLNVAMGTVRAPETPKMVPKGTFKNKFNVDAYHGTKGNIEEFNPETLGASTGANSAKKAYFFAEDPSTASDYANLSNSRLDLRRSAGEDIEIPKSGLQKFYLEENLKSLELDTPEQTKSYIQQLERGVSVMTDELNGKLPTYKSYDGSIRTAHPRPKDYLLGKLEEYQTKIQTAQESLLPESEAARLAKIDELKNEIKKAESEKAQEHTGQNVLPVKLRMENPYIHDFKGQSYRDEPYSVIIDKAKAAGHDSVIFKNTYDPADPNNRVKQNIYAVFEPHQIRSKFAEFNPKQAKSGKLSYSSGGMVQGYADGGEVGLPPGFEMVDSTSPTINNESAAPSDISGSLPEGFQLQDDVYGTPTEMAKTALEGVAQGVAGPLATGVETELLGVKPEDIRGREEANPMLSGASKAAGFIGSLVTGVGEGALVAKAGEAAVQATKLADAASLSAKLGAGAVRGATEMGLLNAGDEMSHMIRQDPNASLSTAAINVGLYGILGGAAGGAAFASISPLFKSISGKLPQALEDFKGRIYERSTNPNMAEAVKDELQAHYAKLTDLYHETYGPAGIKAKDIAAAMPELSDKILDQSSGIVDKLDATIQKLSKNDSVSLLEEAAQKYKQQIQTDNPAQIFNATQELKQQLQEWGKYNKDIVPLAERPFRNAAKDLGFELRNALEDTKVWDKAADRQRDINKAFTQFKPALDEFEKKFTTKIADIDNGNFKRVVDPGKIQTLINQIDKPNAEVKKEMLANFLKSSEKYEDTIRQSHMNLGIETPFEPSSLSASKGLLEDRTTGMKLADFVIDKLGLEGGASGLGTAIGATAGHMSGIPGGEILGGYLGKEALSPFFKSVMPAILKSLLEKTANAESFRAASELGLAIVKGEKLMNVGVKDIFEGRGKSVLSDSALPNPKDINKLKELVESSAEDPKELLNVSNSPLGHYLPDHGVALGSMAAGAMMFLNSLRPNTTPQSPLDSPITPNAEQKSKYNNALMIAQQPLIVLDKIKEGTLTPNDVNAIKAAYPALYPILVSKINAQLIDNVSKKKLIPYKTRQGISLFTGQPLDTTLSPQGILNAQPQSKPDAPAPIRKPSVAATSKLLKLNNLYKTPLQNSQERKQSSH